MRSHVCIVGTRDYTAFVFINAAIQGVGSDTGNWAEQRLADTSSALCPTSLGGREEQDHSGIAVEREFAPLVPIATYTGTASGETGTAEDNMVVRWLHFLEARLYQTEESACTIDRNFTCGCALCCVCSWIPRVASMPNLLNGGHGQGGSDKAGTDCQYAALTTNPHFLF